MPKRWSAWGDRPFLFTAFACVVFVISTVIAMLLYPGGSVADPNSRGYSFFHNFFSSLGLTVAVNGDPNTWSLVLFVGALILAGLGLAWFFVAVPQFYRRTRAQTALSLAGSLFGVLSGLCYIGVALTPANLVPGPHGRFTLWAFQAFLLTAVLYAVATWFNQAYPKVYAWVYVGFAVLLAGYVWLMLSGPDSDTVRGAMIQATGQKIIVYAAICCMLIQSVGAIRLWGRGAAA